MEHLDLTSLPAKKYIKKLLVKMRPSNLRDACGKLRMHQMRLLLNCLTGAFLQDIFNGLNTGTVFSVSSYIPITPPF